MIISDLQYIEAAGENVQGGGSSCGCDTKETHGKGKDAYKKWRAKYPFNQAGADAMAEAFGFNTKAFTNTDTLTIEGEFSGSSSSSYSESSK